MFISPLNLFQLDFVSSSHHKTDRKKWNGNWGEEEEEEVKVFLIFMHETMLNLIKYVCSHQTEEDERDEGAIINF